MLAGNGDVRVARTRPTRARVDDESNATDGMETSRINRADEFPRSHSNGFHSARQRLMETVAGHVRDRTTGVFQNSVLG